MTPDSNPFPVPRRSPPFRERGSVARSPNPPPYGRREDSGNRDAPQTRPEPDEWQLQAACRGMDQELFFGPDERESRPAKALRIAGAKLVCNRCPVTVECLAEEADMPEQLRGHGIRGGLTPQERR